MMQYVGIIYFLFFGVIAASWYSRLQHIPDLNSPILDIELMALNCYIGKWSQRICLGSGKLRGKMRKVLVMEKFMRINMLRESFFVPHLACYYPIEVSE